jgi:hypothetical protein
MSVRAVVSGVLFKAPVEKTSRAGKRYVFATVREGNGGVVRGWRVFLFHESAIEEIMRLGDGEPIAIAGEFNCGLYTPDGGQPRLRWKMTADAILSAKVRREELDESGHPKWRPAL